ncbi:MMPL family transporter [Pseudomonas fluorescens]|nr:MMPL family transporter [Pseudomonas fluorescens]
MPVVSDFKSFNCRSGGLIERIVFNNRLIVLLAFLATTLVLGYFATQLRVNASFERMIPQSHPYIKNYHENITGLRALGNSIRVVVENRNGDIFDKDFQLTVQRINDKLYLMPGVDRAWLRSLWTPNVRWTQVTEEGYQGGPVMPDGWDGSPEMTARLRTNIQRAGIVGSYVADDFRSTMIVAPLLETDPETGEQLDYGKFSRTLERELRSIEGQGQVRIHIVGFAKIVGDLIEGLYQVSLYFFISAAIAGFFVYLYTRCLRSTVLLVVLASLGVVWLLGVLALLGFELDPYSILAPFLIFAIGLSHGAQKMNGIMQDIGRGSHKYVAARYTFRRLFLTGVTALLANAVGFAVLMIIDIPVIRNLAVTTSIGVFILIFTKLLMIPVLLSYVGVSPAAARRSLVDDKQEQAGKGAMGHVWRWLVRFTERRRAIMAISVALVLTTFSSVVMLQLKVGDIHPGAPELRPDSRYNLDEAYITARYGLSSDLFAVIARTPKGECHNYPMLVEIDRLTDHLRGIEGVRSVRSLADQIRVVNVGGNEGNPKFATLPRNPAVSYAAVSTVQFELADLANTECDVMPVIAYLADHKADTLSRVADSVEGFAAEHDSERIRFLLAAGSAGVEAATNMVVRESIVTMYLAVYGAVALLCLIAFRSWRAVLVALIPLVITSIVCKAVMVWLGIGLKVATLPVIALGVGVGVDYALYLLSIQLLMQRRGASLTEAYRTALLFTGKVVALVGITMVAGVVTWAWSPIRFQADLGILLALMFLWNMIGALILVPALSHFLLRNVGKENRPGAGTEGCEAIPCPVQDRQANIGSREPAICPSVD